MTDMDEFNTLWKDGIRAKAKELERLNGFFHFCGKRKWIAENPAADLEAPVGSGSAANRMPFTDLELLRIYEACYRLPEVQWKNHLGTGSWGGDDVKSMVILLSWTGLLISDGATFDMSLQNIGFTDAITVERLLRSADPRIRLDIRGKVIILDEAGMVSARQMSGLLRSAVECSLRVVFGGDTKQIRSVEAGDALRILEKESRLKTVTLTQVQRQSRKDYRAATEELRRNPEQGFARLDALGAVREVRFSDRAEAIADAYSGVAGRTLVVCATNDEINRVTEVLRERRKARGLLGQGTTLTRHVSLNWTAAQKADLQNYRLGQLLGFRRPPNPLQSTRPWKF
jgi:hypothetical protein